MKRIFIFPSIEEAKGFILTEPRDAVFIGGVGMAQTAAAVVRAVKAKKPHLIVLCGLSRSLSPETLPIGQVVEVVTERIAGLADEYETSAPDTGLALAAGVTYGGPEWSMEALQADLNALPDSSEEELLPLAGNMEGAAFFAACDALGVAGCQIRAIASLADHSPLPEQRELAIRNLTEILTQTFRNDE